MSEPLTYLDGHCQHAPGTAETYHHLCPGEMTTQFGVRRVCVCPGHAYDYDCLRCGRRVMRGGIRTPKGWFHVGCHTDDEIQRRQFRDSPRKEG